MRSIESEGDTIDQAIDNALQALELGRDRVEIEILTDATKGLFGFGGSKARVRATVRASLWKPTGGEETTPPAVPRETPGRRPEAAQISTDESTDGRPAADRQRPQSEAEFETRCSLILQEMLTHIGVPCTITIRPGVDPTTMVLDVTGDSGGLLIGRRGQTLDAIEYLLNRIISRDDGGTSARVAVDVERYRDRRREYLEALARRLAEKARQTGRVVTLNPMSPRERRIVHLALEVDPTVTTRSQGEGHLRKVLILPADRRPQSARTNRDPG